MRHFILKYHEKEETYYWRGLGEGLTGNRDEAYIYTERDIRRASEIRIALKAKQAILIPVKPS